jgi:hypothetical protein
VLSEVQAAGEMKTRQAIDSLVGPAGLSGSSEIKHLQFNETIGLPDASPCLSQQIVSPDTSGKPDFDALEHSVYCGRQRLGRYSRVAVRLYAAYDAQDCLLSNFKTRKDAWGAISRAAGAGQ